MENRIDIKNFIAVTIYKFDKDGILKEVDKKLDGKQLEFYSLDVKAIKNLKDIDKEDEISFIYKVIPYISNIEMTIDSNEFRSLCEAPTPQFLSLIDAILEHIKNLHKTTTVTNSIDSKVQELKELYKINEIQELEPVKTKEEMLEELYSELGTVRDDKEKRKEILKKINDLEMEE